MISTPHHKDEATLLAEQSLNFFAANVYESNSSAGGDHSLVFNPKSRSKLVDNNGSIPSHEQYNLTSISKNEMTVTKQIIRLGRRQRNSTKNPSVTSNFDSD